MIRQYQCRHDENNIEKLTSFFPGLLARIDYSSKNGSRNYYQKVQFSSLGSHKFDYQEVNKIGLIE